MAARAGDPAVWIVATAASRQIPFGALGTLLSADMTTVHPALVPSLLSTRLRAAGGGRAPLLAVDDAQLLDDHAAAAILALVTGGATRLLVTVRSGTAASDAVTALWKDRLLARLDLLPLERADARGLLADLLGGDVASGTVELLWSRSQGNPLYLTELVRFGVATGRLRQDSGVWWWSGDTGLPPRLGELLHRRLEELSPAGRDALDMLAFGDGLPYETLTAVVAEQAVLEVEEHGVACSDERDGVLRLRFAHPLLQDVAERRLTPARRRSLAARLRQAPGRHVDVVQRAAWEEAAEEPDAGVLLSAADSIMLSDPAGAVRLAERAVRYRPSVRAALALSAARSEAGLPVEARDAWRQAQELAGTDEERFGAGLEDVSLSLWNDRKPARAARRLERLTAELPGPRYADELDSVAALVALFSARVGEALVAAEAVLDRDPGPDVAVRALTVRLAALVLTERIEEAMAVAGRLLGTLAETPVAATRSGLAHAFAAWARLYSGPGGAAPPAAGGSGRWPGAPVGGGGALPEWALLVGVRHHLTGNWALARSALREAFVQQRSGEGLFRSEAAASLIVVLAESGEAAEAARLLAEHPPDDVAFVPGMRAWAEAAVAAADGPSAAAGEHALHAAAQAAEAGALPTAMWYLADAARYGGSGAAEAAARALGALPPPASGLSRTRAAGILARAGGRPDPLLAAAQAHLRLGLARHAAELAELAAVRDRRADGVADRAEAVRRRALTLLGELPGPTPTGLTRRELEIARMAANGMSDRDIAGSLVVSVRTVETHLRATYRKLEITSRRALAEALRGG